MIRCGTAAHNTVLGTLPACNVHALLQVLALPGITSSVSKVVFHSEDPNIFMTVEQRCWTCFVYCPVTARGPEVLQIDAINPPVSYQPLLFSYGVVACQLDSGQVSRHDMDVVQVHDPEADDYDAEAHTRWDPYSLMF